MASISITKKDVIWSYIAQFFNIGAGLITLPLILHKLSADEIGMNYLMITISTMVGLLDFGFAPQFARNITYVFAGAHELKKEGVAESHEDVDYSLLNNMIGVAKMVYSRLAIISFGIMISFGTWYIYRVTDGFTNVPNSLLIWVIYSVSVFFNVFFVYYSSLLTGRGYVMQAKKAMIAQRSAYIILTYLLILLGYGLLGVVIANLIAPFIGRFLSFRFFYDKDMKTSLASVEKSKEKQKELFATIWYNSKKLGLVFLGSYAINKMGMFIAGLFLSLEDIASYGLMIQLFSIVVGVSTTFNSASQPLFAAYRTKGEKQVLIRSFSFVMIVFYMLFITGTLFIILLGPYVLKIFGSNAVLPSITILIVYSVVLLLENDHSAFATFIITENKIPFVESSLIAGGAICLFSFISLKFTTLGILGLVLVQGLCQLVYANWKWPYVVCREFQITFPEFLRLGYNECLIKIKKLW